MKTMHDDWTPELKADLAASGVTRGEAAEALRISIHTLNSWMKPATSKSANPTPMWAVELFRFKFKSRLTARRRDQDATGSQNNAAPN